MRPALLALALVLTGCGRHKPSASDPSADEAATYNALVARLPSFEDAGWVVSRGGNTNQGDSLLFSGLALYGLPCDAGEPVATALESAIPPVRYPGNTDPVSFDGYVGLYRGIASRVARCGEHDRWAAYMTKANLPALPVGFDHVRKLLGSRLGLNMKPSDAEQARLELDSAGFAAGAVAAHQACFRVNLSLLALQTIEDLGGKVSDLGRKAFCDATRGARIETVEHFCGRSDLSSYLDGFQENVWIFAHQRCPGWETPDAANGDQEPGLDFLTAYQDKQLGL